MSGFDAERLKDDLMVLLCSHCADTMAHDCEICLCEFAQRAYAAGIEAAATKADDYAERYPHHGVAALLVANEIRALLPKPEKEPSRG